MRRLILALTVGILGLMAVPAAAQDKPVKQDRPAATLIDLNRLDPVQQEQITFLLSGYHYFPDQAKLLSVSPNAVNLLMAIAEDNNNITSLRVQAIRALGLFPNDDQAAAYLQLKLQDTALRDTYVRASMNAAMHAFPDRALKWVEPWLEHGDVQLRISAIHTVGKLGGEPGKALLRQRVARETDPLAKESLQRMAP